MTLLQVTCYFSELHGNQTGAQITFGGGKDKPHYGTSKRDAVEKAAAHFLMITRFAFTNLPIELGGMYFENLYMLLGLHFSRCISC